jgi:hypothetical protein
VTPGGAERGEERSLGGLGMTARKRGKTNPRTGLKTGHYIRKRAARLPALFGGST